MVTEKKKTATVPLSEPVEFDGKTYKELTLRRMKAKDALLGDGETNEVMVGYLTYAAMAGVPVEVIGELDLDDLEALSAAAVPLMGKSAAAAIASAQDQATAETATAPQ